jgi:hypothetical protein
VGNLTVDFKYDGDERGYFGPKGLVRYRFNSVGFRGNEYSKRKPVSSLRVAIFGDSITVGHGVHFEDIYSEVARRALLQGSNQIVEVLNFGVGAYNSDQEKELVKLVVPEFKPDVIVLGYFMNDPEDRLPRTLEDAKEWNPVIFFRARNPTPNLYILRPIHKLWTDWNVRNLTLGHYREIYDPDGYRWLRTKKALVEIGKECRKSDIPCVAIIFPILWELGDYPLRGEHQLVLKTLSDAGFVVVDLLAELRGYSANELRVHSTDDHPNELVHQIAGERLARTIADLH